MSMAKHDIRLTLKTAITLGLIAYCLKPHRKKTFAKERDAFWQAQND